VRSRRRSGRPAPSFPVGNLCSNLFFGCRRCRGFLGAPVAVVAAGHRPFCVRFLEVDHSFYLRSDVFPFFFSPLGCGCFLPLVRKSWKQHDSFVLWIFSCFTLFFSSFFRMPVKSEGAAPLSFFLFLVQGASVFHHCAVNLASYACPDQLSLSLFFSFREISEPFVPRGDALLLHGVDKPFFLPDACSSSESQAEPPPVFPREGVNALDAPIHSICASRCADCPFHVIITPVMRPPPPFIRVRDSTFFSPANDTNFSQECDFGGLVTAKRRTPPITPSPSDVVEPFPCHTS